MSERSVVLIVANSSRALAQSIRRAGKVPVGIDSFGDEDACAACRELVVAQNTQEGFAHFNLDPIVSRLVQVHNPMGIVYGSGFEECPDQLARLARHAPLFGTPAGAVTAAKDPFRLSEVCAEVDIQHPEIRRTLPLLPQEWILKRAGGSGGRHIRNAVGQQPNAANDYWQRRINGKSISLLFASNESAFVPLGWSEQWTSPTLEMPYRYGGAAGPTNCPHEKETLEKLCSLANILGLKGLVSADFIDDGRGLWLLEINPRPGATLDVFDTVSDPLMGRHLNASYSPSVTARLDRGVRASAIVYAEEDVVVATHGWPAWIADRPANGTIILEGAPICTVQAEGEDLLGAKNLLLVRARSAIGHTLRGRHEICD